ncbi:MAG: diacylglycerol kinase [Treponema sp.]|jgi:diacylglycerol kinase family enzyme|nr:diacylglycerol kinase [Treponema sp.]
MNIESFAGFIAELCAYSLIVPECPLRWTIIANPGAGGFTISRRWKEHRETLKAAVRKACGANKKRKDSGASQTALNAEGNPKELSAPGLIATRDSGHAGRITGDLLREASAEAAAETGAETPVQPPLHLIICAGGDGTSLEVLSCLHNAPPELRDRFVILRLPMGTGNDGADSRNLAEALDLLVLPTEPAKIPALRLTTSIEGKGPFLAFNILSVGLDAFVTHMTNKMKGKFPGDSYKLWVDIASLLYDKVYKVGPMEIHVFDDKNTGRQILRETPLLLAFGASGRRSYGSGKQILPDDRNVCIIRQMPLLRKLALKNLIMTGHHADKAESLFFNAPRIEFWGREPILAQMDGETVLIQRADFPLTIELTEPSIQILRRT